jgi:hypothetical protein
VAAVYVFTSLQTAACLSRPAGVTHLQGVYLQYNRVQDIFVGTSPFGIVIVKPKLLLRTYDFDGHIAPSPTYLPPRPDLWADLSQATRKRKWSHQCKTKVCSIDLLQPACRLQQTGCNESRRTWCTKPSMPKIKIPGSRSACTPAPAAVSPVFVSSPALPPATWKAGCYGPA